MKRTIFTVGHSNHTFGKFLEILKSAEVNAIVDCRSMPYSKFAPQFNKENINTELNKNGIKYIPMAHEFGARRLEKEVYTVNGEENYVDFTKCWGQLFFQQGVERLIRGCEAGFKIALLCSEADPTKCHRTWMVAHYLWESQLFEVFHLYKDCTINDHNKLLENNISREKTVEYYSKKCAYKQ